MNVDVVAGLLHKHPFVGDLDTRHTEILANLATGAGYEKDLG